MSNLIDRLMFQGRVTDFQCRIGFLRTGIFNVADMTILAGALLMLLKQRADGRIPARGCRRPAPALSQRDKLGAPQFLCRPFYINDTRRSLVAVHCCSSSAAGIFSMNPTCPRLR